MTGLDKLFSYFPLFMSVVGLLALGVFAQWPNGWSALLLVFVIYLFPPMVLRILERWTPIKQGVSLIDDRKFNPWLAAHHIQAMYDALPFLEALLRVIPGFYSMWLRMWGSRIGFGVEWPVRIDVLDRNLVNIGNRVVFARETEISAHARKKREDGVGLRVLVRQVRIGSHAFIGAGSRLGPGASVPANAALPPMTVVDVNEAYGEAVRHPEKEEAGFALS